MQMTAHWLTSVWTTVRSQLRDHREAHAAQVELERRPAGYNTRAVLIDPSNVLGHRI